MMIGWLTLAFTDLLSLALLCGSCTEKCFSISSPDSLLEILSRSVFWLLLILEIKWLSNWSRLMTPFSKAKSWFMRESYSPENVPMLPWGRKLLSTLMLVDSTLVEEQWLAIMNGSPFLLCRTRFTILYWAFICVFLKFCCVVSLIGLFLFLSAASEIFSWRDLPNMSLPFTKGLVSKSALLLTFTDLICFEVLLVRNSPPN